MRLKYDQNLIFLWLFLLFQTLVLVGYLKYSSSWSSKESGSKQEKREEAIQFFENHNQDFAHKLGLVKYKGYFNADDYSEIYLRNETVNNFYTTINDRICFKFGTNIGYMQRNYEFVNEKTKCECLPGYHGNDCSLPEVIWRAFIAYRQETVIQKRNSSARRILHLFHISNPEDISLAVIKINELSDTVDLFIISEANETQIGGTKPLHFKLKLDKGLCKEHQHKILFVPIYKWKEEKLLIQESWAISQKLIKNLNDDDVIIQLGTPAIPNVKALLFFKLYNGFSLPLQFRLKWNVFGYYYQHPNKTKTFRTGYTPRMLQKAQTADSIKLIEKDGGLIVGDLNHYGGWFCDLCYDIKKILQIIQATHKFNNILSSSGKELDEKLVEDIIGEGLYIDGKTVLLRIHEQSDNYYAPEYVANHYWKFDSLMNNFYNKIDYN